MKEKNKRLPELDPSALKIDKLIQKIENGDILIPAFQRGFVWKQDQVIELLDSIVDNYPIGSALLWSTKDRIKNTRNIAGYKIPSSDPELPTNYVLDGQQRISTIYGVFSQNTEQEIDFEGYQPKKDLFEIYYDFKLNKFLPKPELTSHPDTYIYLRSLLNVTTLMQALNNLNKKYHARAQELVSKFNNYEIPIVTIKHRTKEEVAVIFERINNTGTKLSMVDLMTAWTWTEDFHLLEELDSLRDDLEERGFEGISNKLILQIISGILNEDTTTQGILDTKSEDIRDNWLLLSESIKKGIDWLSSSLNCKHYDFLPFNQQLIPIIKFHAIAGTPTANHYENLTQWFWRTSFSDRYSSGTTTAKMNTDIQAMKSIRKGGSLDTNLYETSISSIELMMTKFSKGNPITRAFLLLLSQLKPKDMISNTLIDTGNALSKYNRKEYHHIFPRAYLKKLNAGDRVINSVVNFCFLSSQSNKKISTKKPSDYIFNLIDKKNRVKILESNLIPTEERIFKENEYIEFLEVRANLIITKVKELAAKSSN